MKTSSQAARRGRPRAKATRAPLYSRVGAATLVMLLGACSGEEESTLLDPAAAASGAGATGSGSPAAGQVGGAVPTFYEDVGPIFAAKCTGCHQAGGIAPFPLDDYEAARVRGAQIADYTESRIMPPYAMQTGGECGSFDESAALTPEEIALIGSWGRGERAEGAVVPLPARPLPALEDGTELALPEFVPQVDGSELALFDEYRCFLVDPALEAPAFITGYDVLPGNAAIVHHVLGFLVDPDAMTGSGLTNAEVLRALDGADPERDGWSCFGAAGDGVEVEAVPVTWGPGQGVVHYAGGVGVPVLPNRKLVIQVHYNLADSANLGQSDQTRVRLKLEPSVPRVAAFILEDPLLASLFEGAPTVLEPGQPSVPYVWERTGEELGIPPGVSAELISILPHMHERGRKFTFEVDNGAGYDCQGHVERWDFEWQRHYDYAAPLPFTADTRVRVTCDFDTTGLTEPVLPGWGTRNEMCLATLMLALPGAP